jgi:hypothetical protein
MVIKLYYGTIKINLCTQTLSKTKIIINNATEYATLKHGKSARHNYFKKGAPKDWKAHIRVL